MEKGAHLQGVLDGLMSRYQQRVKDVEAIIAIMQSEGLIKEASDIENDHIAFRTLGVPNLGIQSLEKIFIGYGYTKMEAYYFQHKKLDAWWYAPPVVGLPRIFISELRVKELSKQAQDIIHSYTDVVKADPVDKLDLNDTAAVDHYLHSSSWDIPSLADYEKLAAESEYAAWAIYNRYYLNHYTLSVHHLPEGYNTLEQFNAFLIRHGIVLNDSGGLIKKSADGLLLQSSTVAELVEGVFKGGEKKMIPGSYVEFAERKKIPGSELHREGFEAGNADKIFESTFMEQVSKR